MFNPITCSENIEQSYVDYIQTSFPIADKVYRNAFVYELEKEGMVTKGPYLDIGSSYATGKTLSEMMDEKKVSHLFKTLETVPEKDRTLRLKRPLYLHQQEALEKAVAGKNLVVTTGTGSGKPECFLMPIINQLLREEELGALGDGVRAIIIYPMNALANDQMKRMRQLLRSHPSIKFGLYNGDTRHRQSDAVAAYRELYKDDHGNSMRPLDNELLSREVMQQTPPHILITNYSMLEYMLLRPKDDAVFSGAQLRYIVLDEAHIYRGSTGMETSHLMRHLRARISDPVSVQYILTSATLGGLNADGEIVAFANRLCSTSFEAANIVRSTEKEQRILAENQYPMELFRQLAAPGAAVAGILQQYDADFAPHGDDFEKLFALCLHSAMFAELRRAVTSPITLNALYEVMQRRLPGIESQQDLVDFITLCSKAEKEKTSLVKVRYHYFVRALEGAYITLTGNKELYLQRKQWTPDDRRVFECAVCTDCGRLAVVGKTEGGQLNSVINRFFDNEEYYLLKESGEADFMEEEDRDEAESDEDPISEFDYVLCPICGTIGSELDVAYESPCDHRGTYLKVRKSAQAKQCPACKGSLRPFYIGGDAATAVLGTALYEELPYQEIITTEVAAQKNSIFGGVVRQHTKINSLSKQFLCFSDSRSEAAFFACYMEKSYEEFLRRRGIWQVADQRPVDRLALYISLRIAIHACRSQSEVEFTPSSEVKVPSTSKNLASSLANSLTLHEVFPRALYRIDINDAKALLDLLIMDIVYAGAITGDASCRLTDADREYIFYSPKQKTVKLLKQGDDLKKNWILGWKARVQPNGNLSPCNRIKLLTRALNIDGAIANQLLSEYWQYVLAWDESAEKVLPTDEFIIRFNGNLSLEYYRCGRCGRVTSHNCKNECVLSKCDGRLQPYEPSAEWEHNHYVGLYKSPNMKPIYIKEHTAQLSRAKQSEYQLLFVQKRLNALSCSTTFEMGVDVGSLETVYLRDVPPSPANYVQRAGRAGRSLQSAAYALTYAKLSSHDFTYYQNPEGMISGKIKAPQFEIHNQKITLRHIFAVALSRFFALYPAVYAENDRTVLLNEPGSTIPASVIEILPHTHIRCMAALPQICTP